MIPTMQEQRAHGTSCIGRALDWGYRLLRRWFKLQVGHRGGKYSVERLLALEEYTRTASAARVLFVCMCTPLPIICVSVAQEMLPLQDPSDGSYANYGFWVRTGLVTGVVAAATAAQAHFMVDRVNISQWQLMIIGLSVGSTFPAIAMVIASALVFPVPFIVVSGLPLFYVLWIGSIRAIVGSHVVLDITANRAQLIHYIRYVCAESAMVVIYPAYQMLFTVVINTRYELAVILLLPFIKLLMKNLLWLNATHLHDLMPEAVIFTADFFNSFYLATCMQRASSFTTITTIAAIDFCQTAIALYSLHNHTRSIRARVREVFSACDGDSLLESICLLFRDSDNFTKQARTGINLRSCLQYCLSDTSRGLVDNLERASNEQMTKRKKSTSFRSQVVPFNDIIQPTMNAIPKLLSPTDQLTKSAVKPRHIDRQQSVEGFTIDPLHTRPSHTLREALETLFTSECHVLTEYLESVIPVLYGCLVLVIVRLPNAKYHIDLEDTTVESANSTVTSVFIYGLLEIVSFVVLVAVMQRNCGMNALYQLAFVLETQVVLVQGNLMSWVLITLAFRVVHFGKETSL